MAGWLRVDPAARDEYVASCRAVVESAHAAPGQLEFAITADSVDPGLIRIHEQWEDEASLLAFRGSGPDDGQTAQVLDADVRRFEISSVGPA
ncbi:putative quinol monooxygenase [Aeromicrobium sp. Leaf350]|uniref:putative quinol monooxygenase n=1 Tax=Aeromicrobium sp. Leaf350 TaxID=2876565 RepID=UPI001E5482D0|nr:antibiotic biosynthesis monooxygenase family protein [Aeromicrobium sp. Leaf350]